MSSVRWIKPDSQITGYCDQQAILSSDIYKEKLENCQSTLNGFPFHFFGMMKQLNCHFIIPVIHEASADILTFGNTKQLNLILSHGINLGDMWISPCNSKVKCVFHTKQYMKCAVFLSYLWKTIKNKNIAYTQAKPFSVKDTFCLDLMWKLCK